MSLYGARQLADSMRAVRRNTIAIAEDIPESKYAFRELTVMERLLGIVLRVTGLA